MKTTDIVAQMVELLSPLTSDERRRVVQATLTLIGEPTAKSAETAYGDSGDQREGHSDIQLPTRARSWMKQNGISLDELEEVYHFGDRGIEVIVSEIPGKNNVEKVPNAYVLSGVVSLLSDGSTNFDDKSARDLCRHVSCYDHTNHTKRIKSNKYTGSKEKGWSLTGPGLKHAAFLVKELNKSEP